MKQIGNKHVIKIESMLKQAFWKGVLVDENMLSKQWILKIKPHPGRNKWCWPQDAFNAFTIDAESFFEHQPSSDFDLVTTINTINTCELNSLFRIRFWTNHWNSRLEEETTRTWTKWQVPQTRHQHPGNSKNNVSEDQDCLLTSQDSQQSRSETKDTGYVECHQLIERETREYTHAWSRHP